MINFNDILENFNIYKNIIVNLFIEHYGEEYSQIIIKKIESLYIDFTSSPDEDYRYVKTYANEIDKINKLLIKLKYNSYKKVEQKASNIVRKLFLEFIIEELLISNKNAINNNKVGFVNLFANREFDSEYIDAFSTNSLALLNDKDTPEIIKEKIICGQKAFKNLASEYGIKSENISPETVDKIIAYRKILNTKFREYIAKNSNYGKQIAKSVKDELNINLTPSDIMTYLDKDSAYASAFITKHGEEINFQKYVKIPLTKLINMGCKSLDAIIIHELIHVIESSISVVGIIDKNNNNNIINEIRTEMLAIKIVEKLHELGIFIYDNPLDYRTKGETQYEYLFPLAEEFISKNEKIFTECAINNTPEKLVEYFGESWPLYSKHIEKLSKKYFTVFSISRKIYNIDIDDVTKQLILEMEENIIKKKL